jgi:hypothetical protein
MCSFVVSLRCTVQACRLASELAQLHTHARQLQIDSDAKLAEAQRTAAAEALVAQESARVWSAQIGDATRERDSALAHLAGEREQSLRAAAAVTAARAELAVQMRAREQLAQESAAEREEIKAKLAAALREAASLQHTLDDYRARDTAHQAACEAAAQAREASLAAASRAEGQRAAEAETEALRLQLESDACALAQQRDTLARDEQRLEAELKKLAQERCGPRTTLETA